MELPLDHGCQRLRVVTTSDGLTELHELGAQMELLERELVNGVDRLPGVVEDSHRLEVTQFAMLPFWVLVDEPRRWRLVRVFLLLLFVAGLYPFFDWPSMKCAMFIAASPSMMLRRSMSPRGSPVNTSTHVSRTALMPPSPCSAMRRLW